MTEFVWSRKAVEEQQKINRRVNAFRERLPNPGLVPPRATVVFASQEVSGNSIGLFAFSAGTPGQRSSLEATGDQVEMYNPSSGAIVRGARCLAVPFQNPGGDSVGWAVIPNATIDEEQPKAETQNVCKLIDELESNGVLPASSITTLRTCFDCPAPADTTVSCILCTQNSGVIAKDVNVTISGVERGPGHADRADLPTEINKTHNLEMLGCRSNDVAAEWRDTSLTDGFHRQELNFGIEYGLLPTRVGEGISGWFVLFQFDMTIQLPNLLPTQFDNFANFFIRTDGECAEDRRLNFSNLYLIQNSSTVNLLEVLDFSGIQILIQPQ